MESLLLALQSAVSAYQPPPFVIVNTNPDGIDLWLARLNVVVLTLTLGALGWQVWVANKSATEAARAAAAAEAGVGAASRAATAAEDAVEVSRIAYVNQARAYLTALVLTEDFGQAPMGMAQIEIRNHGQTPAIGVAVEGEVRVLGHEAELESLQRLDPAGKGTLGRAVLPPGGTVYRRFPIPRELLRQLRDGESSGQALRVYLRVTIHYKDCLDNKDRRTDFACRLHLSGSGSVYESAATSVGNSLT